MNRVTIMNSIHSENSEPYNATKLPTVILSHGKESSPTGKKIVALAEVAQKHGYKTVSPDYRGIDDPDSRVTRLLEVASKLQGGFILVGSSMGSYCSLVASQQLQAHGLFLMAPAIGLVGYCHQRPIPDCKRITIIHAWDDEIIPVDSVISYAHQHKADLSLVDSDHRLLHSASCQG